MMFLDVLSLLYRALCQVTGHKLSHRILCVSSCNKTHVHDSNEVMHRSLLRCCCCCSQLLLLPGPQPPGCFVLVHMMFLDVLSLLYRALCQVTGHKLSHRILCVSSCNKTHVHDSNEVMHRSLLRCCCCCSQLLLLYREIHCPWALASQG